MTAVFDTDDVLLFDTARHTVEVIDDDDVIERVGPCDLIDEEEVDGDRLKSGVRLSEFALDVVRETIEVLEEVDEAEIVCVRANDTDADIENESLGDGLFDGDARDVPVSVATTVDVTLSTSRGESVEMAVLDKPVLVIIALVVDITVTRDDIEFIGVTERDFKAVVVSVKIVLADIKRDGEVVVDGDIVRLVESEGTFEVEIVAEDVRVTLLHEEIERLATRDGDKSLEPLAKEGVAVTLTSPDCVVKIETDGEDDTDFALDFERIPVEENDAILLGVKTENEGVLEDKGVKEEVVMAEMDLDGEGEFITERVKTVKVGTAV